LKPDKGIRSMGRVKDTSKKNRLVKHIRQNRAVPTWVIVRTKRKVRSNPKQKDWRRQKLGLK
jgi:large subunit ribosomal protein L39e